ncbi:hypothetical protein SOVF_060500 [Spinacia oleracea]|nr:hypothetical protein SOVF_060500 [Spinacia oleracea]
MPKFLLKTLHRRKPSHHRTGSNSTSISINKYLKDSGTKNDDIKLGKIKRINKFFQRNNKNNNHNNFMQVPRGVTSIMSFVFRNDKSRGKDHQCQDNKPRNMAKQNSKKSRSKEVTSSSAASTSKNCKFGVSDVASHTVNGERVNNRVNSVKKNGENGENVEAKGGVKIKRIIKVKIREKEKVEKRFELCKKKILMGEKCRPLHGRLHYDKNGVLVPQGIS